MKTKLTYHLLDSTMKEYQRLTQFCTGTHQWIIRAREQKEGRGREDSSRDDEGAIYRSKARELLQ